MNLKTRIAKLEQRRAGAEVPLPGLLVIGSLLLLRGYHRETR